jgi:hypothetical protein
MSAVSDLAGIPRSFFKTWRKAVATFCGSRVTDSESVIICLFRLNNLLVQLNIFEVYAAHNSPLAFHFRLANPSHSEV